MKQLILLEILKKLKDRPDLLRKAKVLAAVGAIGLFATGALAIWAGVSAINYVAKQANVLMQSPQVTTNIESLKTEAKGLRFQPLNCWVKAQGLMAVEPWLLRPALENLKNLKMACLEASTPACEGDDCTQKTKLTQTTEGSPK